MPSSTTYAQESDDNLDISIAKELGWDGPAEIPNPNETDEMILVSRKKLMALKDELIELRKQNKLFIQERAILKDILSA